MQERLQPRAFSGSRANPPYPLFQRGQERKDFPESRIPNPESRAARPVQAVWSSIAASGALVFTEAMPLLRPPSSAYIWLLPMVWPLVAVRLKKNLPLLAVLRSKRASSWLFLRTDSMPLLHEALAE